MEMADQPPQMTPQLLLFRTSSEVGGRFPQIDENHIRKFLFWSANRSVDETTNRVHYNLYLEDDLRKIYLHLIYWKNQYQRARTCSPTNE